MTTKPLCPLCQARRSSDGLLCRSQHLAARGEEGSVQDSSCTARIGRALGDVRELLSAAAVTYRRGARMGSGSGSRPDFPPIPFDPRIRPAVRDLDRCVCALVSHVLRMPVPPYLSTADLATGLTLHIEQVRSLSATPAVIEWLHDFMAAFDKLEQLVDLPTERLYAGQCSTVISPGVMCMVDLYALPKTDFVECPKCKTQHDVRARRTVMLDAVEEQLLTATDASRALTALEDPVTPERVRKWAERDRLVPRSVDRKGRPLYRVGDIRDLLAHARERQTTSTRPRHRKGALA